MARKKKPPMREWVVRMNIHYSGVTVIVSAATEEDARAAAEDRDWLYDIDFGGAEMTNWSVDEVESNE